MRNVVLFLILLLSISFAADPWVGGTVYNNGDIVTYNSQGISRDYVVIASSTAAVATIAPNHYSVYSTWDLVAGYTPLDGVPWLSGIYYWPEDVVTYNGKSYEALQKTHSWPTTPPDHASMSLVWTEVTGNVSTYTLTTSVGSEATGTITASPSKTEYDEDEEITLTATPDNRGDYFLEWQGTLIDANPSLKNINPLVFTITENTNLVAVFTSSYTYPEVCGADEDMKVDGKVLLNDGLDVVGNIVAGDVISLAENTEGDENNTPTFGLSSKFLHMGLVEGDETIGWGLHLNSMSFDGIWGHNKIYYHGGEHVFSSREDQGTGPDIELLRISKYGDLHVKDDITMGGDLRFGVNEGSVEPRLQIGENDSDRLEVYQDKLYAENTYTSPGNTIKDVVSIQNNRSYGGPSLPDEGAHEISVKKINENGEITHETTLDGHNIIATGKVTAERIDVETIFPEASITVGHGNWLNLNTNDGNSWMLHNPASQDKFLIGYDPTIGGTGDDNIWGYFSILDNGNVGIGTTTPSARLEVAGAVRVEKVIIDDWTIETPDYVFKDDYKLRSLEEVEAHIKEKSHLPEVPSAADMKRDGVDLAEMNMILLKKVEELTLYTIELSKKIEVLEKNR